MQRSRVFLFKSLGLIILFIFVFILKSGNNSRLNADRAHNQVLPTTAGSKGIGVDDEKITITFANYEPYRGFYEPLMQVFHERYPSITVQFVPLDPQKDSLLDLASAADTTLVQGINARDTLRSHYFLDLQPLIEADPAFEPDDFWPGLLSACQDANGLTLGIPLSVSLSGIFYDPKAFDTAGLPFPAPGWTWDDFRGAVTTLAHQDGDASYYGFMDGYESNSILKQLIETSRSRTMDGIADEQSLAEELGWYLDLVQAKAIYPSFGDGWDQWQIAFRRYQPPLWAGHLGSLKPGGDYLTTEDNPFVGFAIDQYGFAPYPIITSNLSKNTTPAITQCAAISAGSRYPRAAWAWLDFLSRQWKYTQPFDVLAQIPPRRSVADTEDYWGRLPDQVETTVRYGLEHALYGAIDWQTLTYVKSALEKAMDEEADLASALINAKSQLTLQTIPDLSNIMIEVATPQPTPPGEAVYLSFYGGGNRTNLRALADTYSQIHPEIVIQFSRSIDGLSPLSGHDPWTMASQQNDCFVYSSNAPVGVQGELLNLKPFLEAEPVEFLDDFYQDFDAGEIFELRASAQPNVVYYNADLLAKTGMQQPGPEWTIDDMLRMAGVVAELDPEQLYGTLFDLNYSPLVTLLLAGRGALGYDASTEPPGAAFDRPEMAAALDWLKGLQQSRILLASPDWETAHQAIAGGQVLFWVNPAGNLGYVQPTEPLPFDVGVAPLPAVPSSEGSAQNSTSGLSYYISNQASNPRACWEWIKHLSEQPGVFGGIPARRSLVDSAEWAAKMGEANARIYQDIMESLNLSVQASGFNIYWPFDIWRNKLIKRAFAGENPQMAIGEAQAKANLYTSCLTAKNYATIEDSKLYSQVLSCANQADPDFNK